MSCQLTDIIYIRYSFINYVDDTDRFDLGAWFGSSDGLKIGPVYGCQFKISHTSGFSLWLVVHCASVQGGCVLSYVMFSCLVLCVCHRLLTCHLVYLVPWTVLVFLPVVPLHAL